MVSWCWKERVKVNEAYARLVGARVEEDGLIDPVRKRVIHRPSESAIRQRSEGQLGELLWF
jgi:hypothetical protein